MMLDSRLDELIRSKGASSIRNELTIDIGADLGVECKIIDASLARALVTGEVSRLLRNQLVVCAAGIPTRSSGQQELFDPEAILETIGRVEKRSRLATRGPRKLDKGPLAGFWRAHFFQASFMPQNLLEANRGQRGFARIRNALAKKHGSFPLPDQRLTEDDLSTIVSAMNEEALIERSNDGDLTGEHIYFAEQDGKRFYLFVAAHTATSDHLTESLKAALLDFPLLNVTTNPSLK